MGRRKHKPKKKPIDTPTSPRYADVLGWWLPVMVFVNTAIFLVYDDLVRNGDSVGLTAYYVPTTRSMTLVSLLVCNLLLFGIGVRELVLVYRRKQKKPKDA